MSTYGAGKIIAIAETVGLDPTRISCCAIPHAGLDAGQRLNGYSPGGLPSPQLACPTTATPSAPEPETARLLY